MTRAPRAVMRSTLAAPPAALWAELLNGRFVSQCLGLQLPAGTLAAGGTVQARRDDGTVVPLTVTEALAPSSLSLRVGGGAPGALRLTVEAFGVGSRLTVLHEDAATEAGTGIAAALAAAPPALIESAPVHSAAALDAARAYLAGSAAAVQALLSAMAAGDGYTRPAAGGFSLVEHCWHLADIEEFGWVPRAERVLAETRPVLPGVDGDRLAAERGYQQRPWRAAARRFVSQRRRCLRALTRFDTATLQRPVVFAGRACSVGEMLAAMVAHDREHRLEMATLWPPTKESFR